MLEHQMELQLASFVVASSPPLAVPSDAVGKDISPDQMSCQTGNLRCHSHSTSDQIHKLDPGTVQFELSEKPHQASPECLDNEQRELGTAVTSSVIDENFNEVSDIMTRNSVILLPTPPQNDSVTSFQTGEGTYLQKSTSIQVSGCLSNGELENKCQLASQSVQNETVEITEAVSSFPVKDQIQSVPGQVNKNYGNEQLDPPSADVAKSTTSDGFDRKYKRVSSIWFGRKDKRTSKSLKKKYMLRSLGSSDRVLRSRTREKLEKPKEPDPNANLVNVRNDREKERRGRKKKKMQGEGIADEFLRIRARLRYLLNRVRYEQSLIDAYSGEGWKGYSMEKLKPEKELQRAKTEILRRKLKIRDLFRHLDTLCAEGRLPESLFDSEGEIDSEDIFCAKCGSKDLTIDNDIILCDGACDRGFHQFCLEPPLLTENIPSGDEGWLCPGCDCKDDCIELLNDSLGTSLSVSDTWERIFPEAAAENNVDHNLGLPSDDSDDDDYDPDVPEGEEVEKGEASSDESDNDSASEELEVPPNDDQYLGLPSDDSEDNDYDPSVADPEKKVTEESSSSDFTSDSEDLAAIIKDSTFSGEDEGPISTSLADMKHFKGSGRQKSRAGKKQSLGDELSSLLEPYPGQEGLIPASGKRHVARLDYKKLYDETYQNVQSDSSDDEEWNATTTPSRRKKLTGKVAPGSPNGKALTLDHGRKEIAHTPRRNTRQNKVANMDNSPSKSLEGSGISGSSYKKPGSSTYRRLGEAVVQRLYKSFKENQYPDRATKESLAQELGITFHQVSKWFENSRWSFRHSSRMKASAGRIASELATCSKAEDEESLGGVEERVCELVSQKRRGQMSRSSRKRKHKSDPQVSDANPELNSAASKASRGPGAALEVHTGHKMKTRKRK